MIDMDIQDAQDFSGNGWLVILGIHEPGPDYHPSRLPLQELHLLFILCILCIDIQ